MAPRVWGYDFSRWGDLASQYEALTCVSGATWRRECGALMFRCGATWRRGCRAMTFRMLRLGGERRQDDIVFIVVSRCDRVWLVAVAASLHFRLVVATLHGLRWHIEFPSGQKLCF